MAIRQLTIDMSAPGGLVPGYYSDRTDFGVDPLNSYLGEDNQVADGIYNPSRTPGYLSPSNSNTTVYTWSASPTFNPRSVIWDSVGGELSVLTSGGEWYYNSIGTTLTDKGDIDATTPEAGDLAIYEINGVRNAFASYTQAGGGDVAAIQLPVSSGSINQTWFSGTASGGSTLATSGDVHLEVADNGFMYVSDVNAIHKVDGTTSGGANGTVSLEVLKFPAYMIITDMHDALGYMFIGVRDSIAVPRSTTSTSGTKCGIYIWDRRTDITNTESYVPLPDTTTVLKVVSIAGVIYAFCISKELTLQIRKYNGQAFPVVKELPVGAIPQYRGSLAVVGNMIEWIGTYGEIYSYGSPYVGTGTNLFKIGQCSATDVGTSDCTATTYFSKGDERFLGWDDSVSDETIEAWSPHETGVSTAPVQGDIYSKATYLSKMSTVRDIIVYCKPIAGTGPTTEATIKVYINQQSTAVRTEIITRDDINKGYIRIPINKSYVNSVQIETEYPTSRDIDANTFHPSIAIVEYDSTDTRG